MIDELCRWGPPPNDQDGIIVGCSRSHEYLLPWWWMHYSAHNAYPVTFFNFGDLSEKAVTWCSQRGQVKTLPRIENFIASKDLIHPDYIKNWESHIALDPWQARQEWFKKPLACLSSPYQRTIWFDLDCQICKPIDQIFELSDHNHKMGLIEDPAIIRLIHEEEGLLVPGQMDYNTGVIGFEYGAPLIPVWARDCLEKNQFFRGDQEVLTGLLHEKNIRLKGLAPIYNWRGDMQPGDELSEFLVVIHWLGECKKVIQWEIDNLALQGVNLKEFL